MNTRPGRDSRHVAWSCRVYAAALWLYPRAHRERWGAEMRQAFRDGCAGAARGPHGLNRWLLRVALPDLLASSFRARVATLFHPRQEIAMRQPATLASAIVLAVSGCALVALSATGLSYALAHGRFAHPGAFDALTALQAMAGVAGVLLLTIAIRELRPVVAANLT